MMFLRLREEIARNLRNSGVRAVSPYKVGIGWIDLAIPRKRIGIDILDGSYESCAERLSSHPFRDVIIVDSVEEFCKEFGIPAPELNDEELEAPSAYVKAIEDALAYLYITGEVYEKEIDYRPLNSTLPDLKRFGYAVSYSKPKLNPQMFVCLTHDGYTAAKKVVLRRVELFEKRLRKLSTPENYIIALGMSAGLKVFKTADLEDYDLKSLLSFMRKLSEERFAVDEALHPKTALCRFLVDTALNGKAVKLAQTLSKLGLAFKVKKYSPFGHYLGEEYRIAREAVEALMKFSFAEIPRDYLREFMALTYPLSHSDIYPILSYSGDFLRKAEESGVCRLEGSKITLNEKFVDYAKVRLAMLVEKITENLS
ncbi:MAG: hypothetical protein XD40_1261 [Archaeoglobus fulgidus]|uniref:Uncharacterized protein n=1 Tax=Archaeoglobus fulgidus TaxID=2234 RepID=A0A101DZL4_ARCFL|nr:hypothetical protein [Archaeoglobus fulgidus]KUJ93554.1 MAG: hypothetical protein XD40_1261 [Archaeoglobus fulgidus]KUK06320.1 MAG: Uncharacterized protein XD48_1450 [Archaeoglobus fulgidus]